MAEKSFKEYVIGILLTAVFIISLYNFAIGIGNNYDTDLSIDDKQIDLTSLESNVNDTTNDAQSWSETFRSDNPFVATGALIMFGIWGVIKLMWVSATVLFNILLGGMSTVLGVPPMITGTILTILLIGLIFAAWKAIKSGE